MSKRSTYICDGCGREEPGQDIKSFGVQSLPNAWLHLHADDYTPADLIANNWHYCADCAKRVVAFLTKR
jgi:hypothetical protein